MAKINIKETLQGFRNDGTDPRKNDPWRIVLFALNQSSGLSIMHLMNKWSYYTQNVLELGAILASVVTFMMLLDAITDPLIATLFDRFESKRGKLRPFMFCGCLMSALPAIVIFCYPVNPPIPLGVSYTILTLMYAIVVVGNTVIMTATRAGQAIITQDPKQRPLYAFGQTVFDGLVMGFVSIVISSDLFGNMQDSFVWRLSAIVLSTVSIVLMFIAMKAIETRDTPQYYSLGDKNEKVGVTEFIKLLKRSKPMRCLIAAVASDGLAASVRATLAIYLFANVIYNRKISASFDIISGIVISVPILVIGILTASKKGTAYTYKKVSVIQIILTITGFFVCLVFLPPDPNRTYNGFTLGVILVLLFFGLYMGTLGVSSNLVSAMTGDLSDYEYYEHGKFIPGTIGATLEFFNKAVKSFVGLIVTGMMVFCGFSQAGANSVIPENVFVNTNFYYCVIISVFILPAIGHIITYITMRKYPLTAKKMQEVSMFIAEKRGVLENSEPEKSEK